MDARYSGSLAMVNPAVLDLYAVSNVARPNNLSLRVLNHTHSHNERSEGCIDKRLREGIETIYAFSCFLKDAAANKNSHVANCVAHAVSRYTPSERVQSQHIERERILWRTNRPVTPQDRCVLRDHRHFLSPISPNLQRF